MISVSLRDFDTPVLPLPRPSQPNAEMLHARDVAELVQLLIVIQRAAGDAAGWEEVSRLFLRLCDSFSGERLAALRAVREWIAGDGSAHAGEEPDQAAYRRLPSPSHRGDAVDALREIVAPAVTEAAHARASRQLSAATEARLDLCLEHCTQGMMTFSGQGRCLFVNRTATRLLKLPLEPRADLVDRRILHRTLRRLVDDFVSDAAPGGSWLAPRILEIGETRLQCFPLVVNKPGERGPEPLLHLFLLAEAKSDDLAARLLRRVHLSKQETFVVQAILEGKSNAAIAREMALSVHTVRTYVERVYRKLNVANRYELLKLVNSASEYPSIDDDGP
jgi:DNA-binding CsgD family transcriptional regulator/PAS domain-containing protein